MRMANIDIVKLIVKELGRSEDLITFLTSLVFNPQRIIEIGGKK